MSTLRVSNIEAKADPSSPSVDEKLKVTNSNGDVLVHIDGKTAGITTVGINTTDRSFTVDAAQNIEFLGIVTATKFSLSGGGEITGGDGNFTGIVTATSISATDSTIGVATITSLTASAANFTGNVSIAGTLTYEDVTNVDSIGIATARTGIDVTGGHIDLVDNSKIRVGTGTDLEIYHDGTSYIKNTNAASSLFIDSAFVTQLRTGSTSKLAIQCTPDAEVQIWHGAGTQSEKFRTLSTGVRVTGSIEVTQTYPSIRPTLDLNFAATKTLDRRITFKRDGLGTFTGDDGLVKYASSNVPRFDHDPITRESLGLMIEESSTNYMPSTDAASWTTETTMRTTVANDTTAPDGSNTGVRFGGATGQTLAYFYNYSSSSVSSGKTTASWYVKAGTNRYIYIQVIAGTTNNRYSVLFDMDNDAAFVHDHIQGTVSGNSYASEDVGNGWFRLSATMNKSQAGDVYALIGLSDDGNDTWASSATKTITASPSKYVYVWGPQAEDKSYTTSFIPTNGTAATRGQDTAKITGTNFTNFYNQTEGTLVAHYYSTFDDNYIANIENVATPGDDRIGLVNYSAYQGYVETGNSSQASIDNGTPTVGGVNKVAFAFKANDFAVSLNSATPTTDSSGTMPTVDRMMIGSRSGGAYDVFKSTIRHLSYYPKRLPNAQLQGLTQQ